MQPVMPDIDQAKKELRAVAIRKRDAIAATEKEKKDRKIRERLFRLGEFADARVVMLFASFRSEVDTLPVIEHALGKNKTVILPRVDRKNRRLKLYNVKSTSELVTGYMGIPEPAEDREREVQASGIEMVLMPGLAFDPAGNRIGYGGGYYDRLVDGMDPKPPLVAVAYEEQIVDRVPAEDHDILVDIIITDERVIYTDRR